MQTGSNGIALIKESEGCRLVAYQDTGGVWTIGYGDIFINGTRVVEGDSISQAQAELMFTKGLAEREGQLSNAVKVTLNQNQWDALMDFLYEFGIGELESSTLLKKVNVNPNDTTIADEFHKWVYGKINGKEVQISGLITRRSKEVVLYFTPILHV